jgi:hypothetical protein
LYQGSRAPEKTEPHKRKANHKGVINLKSNHKRDSSLKPNNKSETKHKPNQKSDTNLKPNQKSDTNPKPNQKSDANLRLGHNSDNNHKIDVNHPRPPLKQDTDLKPNPKSDASTQKLIPEAISKVSLNVQLTPKKAAKNLPTAPPPGEAVKPKKKVSFEGDTVNPTKIYQLQEDQEFQLTVEVAQKPHHLLSSN